MLYVIIKPRLVHIYILDKCPKLYRFCFSEHLENCGLHLNAHLTYHCLCLNGLDLLIVLQNSIPPLDYREYPSQKRTSMLDDEFISRIVDSVFNEDIKKQIQDVFSSASCLNGSFLKK